MASVNDYLKKLLYQYDCVVVPELGAFLTHYQSASFTETSGLYLPPRKRVAFNEALRFDDGILANYIMLHEPVTREGAQRHVSVFVAELRQQVESTGRFELEGIGTFTHNEESRLQFSPSLRHNFFGEAYGMSALSVQAINRQPQLEPAFEAVPVTDLGPLLVREDDVQLIPYRPARPYWRVAAIALLVSSIGAVSYFSVIKPDQPFQSSLDPASLFRSVTTSFFERFTGVKEPAKTTVISKVTYTPVSEIKPVIEEPTELAVAAPTPTPSEVTAKTELTSADVKAKLEAPAAVKSEVVEKAAAPVAKPVRTGPHFTVIAGVFLSKHNALKLRRQLRKAGYEDAFVIMPAPNEKEMYKVAAAGSSIRNEAVAKMAAIDELAGTESWILKN
ncbi:SPOR domain-containing protein [Spirosoma sp. HMF4905]|uniref:SPOR domain-containing protein n=1 Tax=Spirosoma arboris TaxID=2682092 RepID=A0A7K1SKY2_9BACT|nr:SPOR domain-containing protein [Spirosoma arboris]MVM34467.1 SPOR domain-containing protein [Spirosoma arboris]